MLMCRDVLVEAQRNSITIQSTDLFFSLHDNYQRKRGLWTSQPGIGSSPRDGNTSPNYREDKTTYEIVATNPLQVPKLLLFNTPEDAGVLIMSYL